jgi:hypothetical protein
MAVLVLVLWLWTVPAWAGVIFDDTFTGSSVALNSHTPDTGTSWTLVTNNTTTLALNGSGGVAETAGPSVTRFAFYTANTTYASADYDVEVTFSTFTTAAAGRMFGLVGRWQDANNYYLAWIEDSAGTNDVRLYSCVAGTCTKISSTEDTNPTANDVFLLEMRGSQIGLKKNGSYVINPVTNSNHSAAGKAGLETGDFGDITTASGMGGNGVATRFTVTEIVSATRRPIAPMILP